jgi:hypothetical protein
MQGWLYGKINSQAVLLFKDKLKAILLAKDTIENHAGNEAHFVDESAKKYAALMTLAHLERDPSGRDAPWKQFFQQLLPHQDRGDSAWRVMLIWLFVQHLDATRQSAVDIHLNVVQDWRLEKFITQSLTHAELDENRARYETELIRLLVERERYTGDTRDIKPALKGLLESREADAFLGVNTFQGIEYFNKERFEVLTGLLFALSAIEDLAAAPVQTKLTHALEAKFDKRFATFNQLSQDAERVGYRLKDFLKNLEVSILEDIEPPIAQQVDVPDTAPVVSKTKARSTASKPAKPKTSAVVSTAKKKSMPLATPVLSEQDNSTQTQTNGTAPKTKSEKPASTRAKSKSRTTSATVPTGSTATVLPKAAPAKTTKSIGPNVVSGSKPSAVERAKAVPKKSTSKSKSAQVASPKAQVPASASAMTKKITSAKASLPTASSSKTSNKQRGSNTKKKK